MPRARTLNSPSETVVNEDTVKCYDMNDAIEAESNERERLIAENERLRKQIEAMKPSSDVAAVEEKKAERQIKKEDRVWLVINSTETDSSPVMLSVNGYPMRVRRDVPVLIPKSYVKMLENASYEKGFLTTRPDNGQAEVKFKKVRRFSFSVSTEKPEDADEQFQAVN